MLAFTMLQSVALAVHLQDVEVVSKPIQHGLRELFEQPVLPEDVLGLLVVVSSWSIHFTSMVMGLLFSTVP